MRRAVVRSTRRVMLATAFVCGSLSAGSAAAGPILDFALVVDASPSIISSEFVLQREAYASAFETPEFRASVSRSTR